MLTTDLLGREILALYKGVFAMVGEYIALPFVIIPPHPRPTSPLSFLFFSCEGQGQVDGFRLHPALFFVCVCILMYSNLDI